MWNRVFFCKQIPSAYLLSQITNLILIGKLYSLDLDIKFKIEPFPEINTHVFFLPFQKLNKLTPFSFLDHTQFHKA